MANPISLMRNRFGARVKRITTLSAGIGRHPVGIVRWFHSELGAGGPLENLQHDANAQPQEGRLAIEAVVNKRRILLSDEMVNLFINLKKELKLSDPELDIALDNFIVHEIIHRAQGMGAGNQRNLRSVATNLLFEIDYEADACAVIVLFTLRLVEIFGNESDLESINTSDLNNRLWAEYATIIRSTLHQIHTFSLMDSSEKPTTLANSAKTSITVFRWERMCIWHMQYHRALNFNTTRPIAAFQVLFRPVIGFRNQYLASRSASLNESWPDTERQNGGKFPIVEHMAPIAISGVGFNGVRIHSQENALPARYDNVFSGIFRCDTSKSKALFEAFFYNHPEFTGKQNPPPPPIDSSERWDVFSGLTPGAIINWEFSSRLQSPAVQALFEPVLIPTTSPTTD